jgi:hypothetical protein
MQLLSCKKRKPVENLFSKKAKQHKKYLRNVIVFFIGEIGELEQLGLVVPYTESEEHWLRKEYQVKS